MTANESSIDRIADVLIDHHDELDGFCSCLWRSDFNSDTDSSTQIAYHVAQELLATITASLREQIAAEVLGPVRELADEWQALADRPMPERAETETAEDQAIRRAVWHTTATAARELRTRMSAPVQAAEPRCPTCGGSGSVTVDRGMGPEPVEHCPACAYTPSVQAAEGVGGDDD